MTTTVAMAAATTVAWVVATMGTAHQLQLLQQLFQADHQIGSTVTAELLGQALQIRL